MNRDDENNNCPQCETESQPPWTDTWGFHSEAGKAKEAEILRQMSLIAPTELDAQEFATWNAWMQGLKACETTGDTTPLTTLLISGPEFARITRTLRQIVLSKYAKSANE